MTERLSQAIIWMRPTKVLVAKLDHNMLDVNFFYGDEPDRPMQVVKG
jgi:hypothetical protein